MWFTLRYLYLATVVLCLEQPRVQNIEEVKQSFHFRRAVDGTRGRKYFNPYEDGSYDSYGSGDGHYDSSKVQSGFSNIRSNVPGEPGIDYPVYESVPKTRFSCEGRSQGYYADEEAGCQAFHVCHDVVVSSFICPLGSIFSQELLTCDWWNKVDCGMTGAYSLNQGMYDNHDEMIQRAFTMTKLPDRNSENGDSQIGRGRTNTGNIGFGENGATEYDSERTSFAESPTRETKYYNNHPTKQPEIHENFGFGRNQAIANDNTPSGKNIINVSLRPQEFKLNHQGESSRSYNSAKDSSIFYIQKNADNNFRDSYTTLRPVTFANVLPYSYQQDRRIFRNEFQPSYAPTVPTVTTTTRRLYSPTVPTTYRPSTISYNNYDQYYEGSDHLYTHSRNKNLFATGSTVDSHTVTIADESPTNVQSQTNQQIDDADRTAVNNEQYEDNFAEEVQTEESIGIAQSYGGRLDKVENQSEKEVKDEISTDVQLGESKKQNTYSLRSNLESTTAKLGTEPTTFNPNVFGNQQNYQHFYSNRLARGRKQDNQVIGKMSSGPDDNDMQTEATTETRNEKNLNSIESRLGVSPLIVQIPRPLGLSGRPVTDIADQLFTYDSFIKMSSSDSQSSLPVETAEVNSTNGTQSFDPSIKIPLTSLASQLCETSKQNSTNLGSRIQSPDSSTRIPPLISQSSQSASSSEGQSFIGISDTTTFSSRPKIPSLISQDSKSVATSGGIQSIESSTRIPPLIPQASQSTASSNEQFVDVSDETLFGSPPVIPSLTSQNSQSVGISGGVQSTESSTKIPSLIPQFSQSTAASSGTQSATVPDDDTTSAPPSRTPPLFPQISQSVGSSEVVSMNVDDVETQLFGSPSDIPPLIPQSSQSTASSDEQSAAVSDETLFGSPPVIPSLTSQNSHSSGILGVVQSTESSTKIPSLIPQFSQSSPSSGTQSATVSEDNTTFTPPSRIPPLFLQIAQSGGSSEVVSTNVDDDETQSFGSPSDIPPLIPQSSQSTASSDEQSAAVSDDTILGSPPIIPSSTFQNSQSVGISGDIQSTESSTKIPPLIPQFSQSTAASSGTQSATVPGDDTTFAPLSRIPPMFPQISQSVGSSEVISTNVDDDETQSFGSPSDIPPLIPQSSPSAASSGVQIATVIDDSTTFGTPPRVPPTNSQNSHSIGLSDIHSTNVDDGTQTSDPPLNIPPLISQSSQPTASSGAQLSSDIVDSATFGSPPRISPQISQTSQSIGVSKIPSFTNVDDETQSFGSPFDIPPLIPQSSQTAASSGAQLPSVIDGSTTSGTPPRIPPQISHSWESIGFSKVPSTNVDDGTQTFDSPINIPPLIPQSSLPAVSGAQSPNKINDDTTLNSPPRIPSLVSQHSQTAGSSEVSFTNVNDETQTFDSPINIPPLIPQSSQSAVSSGAQSPSAIDNNTTSDSTLRIPPLISQNSQPLGSSEVPSTNVDDGIQSFDSAFIIPPLIPQSSQSAVSSGVNSSIVIDDNITLNSPPRISSPNSQNPQSVGPPEVHSTNGDDETESFDSPIIIPPLIPQSALPAPSSGAQRPGVIDYDKVHSTNVYDRSTQLLDSSTRVPPLIPQSALPAPSSGAQRPTVINDDEAHSTNVYDRTTQLFDSSTRVPPLIPQYALLASSSGAQRPTVIDDNQTLGSPAKKPSLISHISQFSRPTEVHSWNGDGGTQNVESSSRIPPLISQSSQSTASSEVQSPCGVSEKDTVHGSPNIQPQISQIPQSIGSPEVNLPHYVDETQTFVSSTGIPQSISENRPIDSSEIYPTYGIGEQHIIHAPPRVPPLIAQISRPIGLPGVHSINTFNRGQSLYSLDERPPLISRPADASATYSDKPFNSFNEFTTTTEATYYTFQGQYKRPLPFNFLQTSTELPPRPFVTTSTTQIPNNDLSIQYGSKVRTETTTIRPPGGSVEFTDKEFRIHVPDFSSPETTSSTQGSVSSTPTTISSSTSSDGHSSSVSSRTEQSTLQALEVVTHLPAVDNQQPSLAGSSNLASASPLPENHSYPSLSTGNTGNEKSHTETKAPIDTLSVPSVHQSNHNFFEQDSAAITSMTKNDRPIQQQFKPSHWDYNEDLQYTIRGAQLYPTATPFPSSNAISPTYLPQATETPSGTPGQKGADLKDPNTADDSIRLSHSENSSGKQYQKSTTLDTFHKVTSAENHFAPTLSQSSFGNFGYSKDRFESDTLKNVLDTTNTKFTENLNPSSNGFLQAFGAGSIPSELPSSFGQIEGSLYNNNDSPYELHFTVNADEDFDPSADFISKLLAQYEGNSSLGLDSFAGFEIIKSDSAGGLDEEGNVKSTALPNTVPSEPPKVPRIFDVRGSFGNEPSKLENSSTDVKPNSSTPIPKVSEIRPIEVEQPKPPTGTKLRNRPTEIEKPSDFSRPLFLGSNQNSAVQVAGSNLKSDDVSKANSPHLGGNVQRGQLQNAVNILKLGMEATDINRSLESLFEFVPPMVKSPPLKKEQILEELTKNFGQPLYYRDTQGFVVSSNADNNAGQQFANLQPHRVGKSDVSHQKPEVTNPLPAKPSTTTTPKPIKTVVETEFIPSLSFSFDSDDGRNEYVEAVLQGLLTEHQPIYPWNYGADFHGKSRESSKPSNDNAEV